MMTDTKMAPTTPSSEPIAIIGSSCRFAGGATSPSKLWDVLCHAPDLSREVPADRWNARAFHHDDPEYHGTTDSTKAYWLEEHPGNFDAAFFNITPREAEAMDPQQRISLEVVYEAMEAAGLLIDDYSGKAVGVYAGCMCQDYETLSGRDEITTSRYFPTGNSRAILSNRISYFFNFQGPSMTIDTACSSSLTAMHQAILSLRSGESIMACITGANLMVTPENFIVESSLHMLSASGKCHMWDDRADGYARGEGFAAMLLKPLSRALADGDSIDGIIREMGINADGKTSGITMPNPEAQADLIRETYKRAGLDPTNPADRCQYFEAHGTGTAAGDPREAAAIHNAFFGDSDAMEIDDGKKLLVGSIKTVVGHTESTAGLAGLLKALSGMKHGLVPPNLHFKTLNPQVAPYYKRLEIPTSIVPWPEPVPGQPRRASVNSFGFGGANAHVIVEAYDPQFHDAAVRTPAETSGSAQPTPEQKDLASSSPLPLPIVISAASTKSLRDIVTSYRAYLEDRRIDPRQLTWHQYARQTTLPFRVTVSAATAGQAIDAFGLLLDTGGSTGLPGTINVRSKAPGTPSRIIGVFTGQGAQWPTMSRVLFHQSDVYRNTIRNLDAVLKACSDPPKWTLEEQIMADQDHSRVHQAAVSQPLCTAVQIALVDLVQSIGISFHTVVGHSSGEIAAAYTAGRLSAKDAILISYYRGFGAHLASGNEGQKGGMLATAMSEVEARDFCNGDQFKGRICVAALNSPTVVTLSGDLDAVNEARDQLEAQSRNSRVLRVDSAYHSHHMTKCAQPYAEAMKKCGITPIPEGNNVVWISSVHNGLITGTENLDCQYWVDNMVSEVRFRPAVIDAITMSDEDFDCAVEIGPHPALRQPFLHTVRATGRNDMPHGSPLDRNKDDSMAFSDFLGFLWSNLGASTFDLNKYIQQSSLRAVDQTRPPDFLSYPFDHSTNYWRESRTSHQYMFRSNSPHELLGVRGRDDTNLEMKWRNVLKQSKIPWLEHHSFQGQALLPASAYCVMALDAARFYLAGRPASVIELRDVRIMSGITIDRESEGVETLFALNITRPAPNPQGGQTVEGNFSLWSCPALTTSEMRQHMTGSLVIFLGDPSPSALPARGPPLEGTMAADTDEFYKMMTGTGLNYTGPYKAITSVQRRYRACTATLKRFHPDDTTGLQISPATLDSCLQSAFLTYASPGDRSLWTSFLPTSIDRVAFGLAGLQATQDQAAGLIVDTSTTRVTKATEASRANIAVDIIVYNEAEKAEIQVQGLTVRAIANTQPRDDYELYLHTIMEVDSTDEITPLDQSILDNDDIVLVENCSRVASYLLNTAIGKQPNEDESELNDMIRRSRHSSYLESVREMGRADPAGLSKLLPDILEDARQVAEFRDYVGQIIKQIAHRRPFMDILYLSTSGAELMKPVLHSLELSLQSFTIGVTGEEELPKIDDPTMPHHDKVCAAAIKLEEDLRDQFDQEARHDLILLPTEVLCSVDLDAALTNIGRVMRPGGVLFLVHQHYSDVAKHLTKTTIDANAGQLPTPEQWPEILDRHGFMQQARNSDQSLQTGHVFVRRFQTVESIKPDVLTKNLLLVHGTDEHANHFLVNALKTKLASVCSRVESCSIDEVDAQLLRECTATVILADLDENIMVNMTQQRIDNLKILLRPNVTALWLTRDARTGNPDHAASFGFTRTIAAEFPALTLQTLDLESRAQESLVDTIATAFTRLISVDKTIPGEWEREIHMENGRRVIPRVVPLKCANDRINALRRPVSKPLNVLRDCVQISPWPLANGLSVRFEARRSLLDGMNDPHHDVKLQVDYSSALPFRLSGDISGYVCVGRDMDTGASMIALSAVNASYIVCPASQALKLSEGPVPEVLVLYQLIRCIAALATAWAEPYVYQLILVDPDVEFARCLVDVTAPKGSASLRTAIVATGPNAQGSSPYAGIKSTALRHHRAPYFHLRSTTRDVKAIFPAGSRMFSFLPEDESSRNFQQSLSHHLDYRAGFSMFSSLQLMQAKNFQDVGPMWNFATLLTMQSLNDTFSRVKQVDTVSVSDLISRPQGFEPFQIIDWKRGQDTVQDIEHTIGPIPLRPDRTYIFFGLTRDFGHSLCRLFLMYGARNIVLCSRNPDMSPKWLTELSFDYSADIRIEKADVTNTNSLARLKSTLAETMPAVGGIINGAMVLDDRVFSEMSIETWNRVLRPKTVGSANLDAAFPEPDLDFFIMTSSFAAIGGHPGQANYATANMYMNGLAANRRRRGLAGSVLNIGVIYGLGFLYREKSDLYAGLEREGYPPVSEHDIHHMFLEAMVSGRPNAPNQPVDLTTGLSRFRRGSENPLHWHTDPRFGHFAIQSLNSDTDPGTGPQQSLQDELAGLSDRETIADAIATAFVSRLRVVLSLSEDGVNKSSRMLDLGVDSLVAVEIRNWFFKVLSKEVAVMRILSSPSIYAICADLADQILAERAAQGGADPQS
ncbi:beta-ketoacyl synthase domain-containing protein [Xylariaceae sp. FL0255]|nr:beta-ketoacyl synthase domain-containing protein [Xylariaceae sp. FL0255]